MTSVYCCLEMVMEGVVPRRGCLKRCVDNKLLLIQFKRLASIGEANPAFPQVKMGTPAQFFDRLLERTNNGSSLPTWRGELYFELHRGTYTSQEGLKKGNREMEMLLRDVEYYATIAWLDSKTKGGDYVYPQ